MMKIKFLCFAFILIIFNQFANATNWVEILGDAKYVQQTGKAYVDTDSIEVNRFNNNPSNYYLTTWITVNYLKAKPLGNSSYQQVKVFTYVDCKNKKTAFDELIGYSTSGQVVSHEKYQVSTDSSTNWVRAVPNSLAFAEIMGTCTAYEITKKMKNQR